MADCWIALTTLATRDEGERLAATLVEECLAACVNVIGPMISIYQWEGKVERDTEVLLLIKTTAAGVEPLKERVLDLHPYDTPEFLALWRWAPDRPATWNGWRIRWRRQNPRWNPRWNSGLTALAGSDRRNPVAGRTGRVAPRSRELERRSTFRPASSRAAGRNSPG